MEDDEVFTVNLFVSDPDVTVFRDSADVIILNDDGERIICRLVSEGEVTKQFRA